MQPLNTYVCDVDAHVALLVAPSDVVLTSGPGDIRALMQARGIPARVQPV